MKDFVTAAVFNNQYETAILKHLLFEAGISFYFENETVNHIAPSLALGGIKLKVHLNDLETVKEILENFNTQNTLKIV